MEVISLQTVLHSTLHLTKHIMGGHTLKVHLEEKRIFADSLSFDAIKELKGLRLHIFVSKRLIYILGKYQDSLQHKFSW